jgi:hypothetical protein
VPIRSIGTCSITAMVVCSTIFAHEGADEGRHLVTLPPVSTCSCRAPARAAAGAASAPRRTATAGTTTPRRDRRSRLPAGGGVNQAPLRIFHLFYGFGPQQGGLSSLHWQNDSARRARKHSLDWRRCLSVQNVVSGVWMTIRPVADLARAADGQVARATRVQQ